MFRAGLIVLTLSVTANLYLWFSRCRSTPSAWVAQREKPARMLRLPKPPSAAESPAPESSQDISRSALEQRLLRVNKRIDELLPAKERFEGRARTPDSEAITRSYLDQIFDARRDSPPPYSVECHGLTCRLQTERPIQEWQHALQSSYPDAALFCQMSFSDEVYLDLCDPELWGTKLMDGVRIGFFAADGTSSCVGESTTTGDLIFSIWFDDRERRFHSSVAGSLAFQPVGVCLHGVLDGILARTQVPTAIRSLPESTFRVLLPLQSY